MNQFYNLTYTKPINEHDICYIFLHSSQKQVGQLLQTNRAEGWLSFVKNISVRRNVHQTLLAPEH